MKRGVAPVSVLHWSLLAPDSASNRTTSRCPSRAAIKRGVAPSFVRPRSLLAPDSTRNRTSSRCPFFAAMKRGVAPVSTRPMSFSAPASSSRSAHVRLPLEAATNKGVFAFASSTLGLLGWFRCCSSSLSLFSRHATMISRSCSGSWGRNSIFTSCTTCIAKVWSSSKGLLSWSSRSRNRGTPICCAKRCFNAFTEASANSSFSKAAIDSPVTAETTSTFWTDINKSRISHVNHLTWNILKQNGCLWIWHQILHASKSRPACHHLVEMPILFRCRSPIGQKMVLFSVPSPWAMFQSRPMARPLPVCDFIRLLLHSSGITNGWELIANFSNSQNQEDMFHQRHFKFGKMQIFHWSAIVGHAASAELPVGRSPFQIEKFVNFRYWCD